MAMSLKMFYGQLIRAFMFTQLRALSSIFNKGKRNFLFTALVQYIVSYLQITVDFYEFLFSFLPVFPLALKNEVLQKKKKKKLSQQI